MFVARRFILFFVRDIEKWARLFQRMYWSLPNRFETIDQLLLIVRLQQGLLALPLRHEETEMMFCFAAAKQGDVSASRLNGSTLIQLVLHHVGQKPISS
jgi:hypothetical protein